MPKRILNGALIPDEGESQSIQSLTDWQASASGQAVCVTADDDYLVLIPHLSALTLITVQFADFNDGRGFSLGRRLREAGYRGELRATGSFIRDQLHYLSRCGFDGFLLDENVAQACVDASLTEFSVSYQAAQDDPLPRFNVVR